MHTDTYKTIHEVKGAIHCLINNFHEMGFTSSCKECDIKVDNDYGEGFLKLSPDEKYDLALILMLRLKEWE